MLHSLPPSEPAAYVDYLQPQTYMRARCWPVQGGYRVTLHPTGGAIPGPGWPLPRTFTDLGKAMAWAYSLDAQKGWCMEGLTLQASGAG
jgi:hypothetical protein